MRKLKTLILFKRCTYDSKSGLTAKKWFSFLTKWKVRYQHGLAAHRNPFSFHIQRITAGFIFVQHLRGFLGQLCFFEICFLSTPQQMPQTITNIPRCLPQILTVPEFWYHLAHSFSRKNEAQDIETQEA